MKQSRWLIEKEELVCDNGLVAAKVPLAAQAGAEILERGGNAIDAAVATAFVAGVVEPHMSGIGGGGFMLIHLAKEERNICVDYGMVAPGAAHEEMYPLASGMATELFTWRAVKGHQNMTGYRAIGVPGTVAGLTTALEWYGTLSLEEVLQPAIRHAEEGYEVTWFDALMFATHQDLLQRFGATSNTFLPGNRLPKPLMAAGAPERIRQPHLANTLRAIAQGGPDAFYRGQIAELLVNDIRTHGGIVTADDLAGYAPRVTENITPHPYRHFGVISPPVACGATTILETLNILEGFDLSAFGHNTATGLHHIAEAGRLAFVDRLAFLGDIDSGPVPLAGVLHKGYAAERRLLIDPERALADVRPGDPWDWDAAPAVAGRAGGLGPSGSTTHLSVVDRDRNLVSVTQTLLSLFGSGVVAGETGVLLNNAMMWFNPEPGYPNSPGPGKRPLTNMSPVIVLRDGRPFLAAGSTGGRKVIQSVMHAILNTADFGLGIQAAISAPRMDTSGPEVLLNTRLDPVVVDALRAKGHRIALAEDSFTWRSFGSPACVLVAPDGTLRSGVDVYYPAAAAGYYIGRPAA